MCVKHKELVIRSNLDVKSFTQKKNDIIDESKENKYIRYVTLVSAHFIVNSPPFSPLKSEFMNNISVFLKVDFIINITIFF